MKVSKKHLLGTEVLHLCIVFAGKNVTHYYQSSKCLMHTPKLTCLFYRMESNRILIQMKLNTKTVAHKKSKRTVIVSTKGSLGTSTSVAVWREGLVEKVYCTLKKKYIMWQNIGCVSLQVSCSDVLRRDKRFLKKNTDRKSSVKHWTAYICLLSLM